LTALVNFLLRMKHLKNRGPKSFIEHKQYLYDIVKLKLWFIWTWKQNHSEEPVSHILRERVDIYRKTDINKELLQAVNLRFDDPEWKTIEQRITELYGKHQSDDDAAKFEEEAFQVVQPTIEVRALRDFEEPAYVLDFKCGSLTYEPPKPEAPDCVQIHIANAIAPRSIFDDKKYLLDCFRSLLDGCTRDYNVDSFWTETWLNSYPKWLEYFPEEWTDNMSEPDKDVMWHFGFWGQFITSRGVFNHRLGNQLRETGVFPFSPRSSRCRVEVMREHIEKMY